MIIKHAAQPKLKPTQTPFVVHQGEGGQAPQPLPFVRGEKAKKPMFVDVARTVLPVAYLGREVNFEAHAYEDDSAAYQAMALVHRTDTTLEVGLPPPSHTSLADQVPVVRVHSGCVTGDIFRSLRCDCFAQLQLAIDSVVASPFGIIVYLPHHEGRGIGLVAKIKAYAEQDRGLDTVDANLAIGAPVDARDYELAANILKDLGVSRIRLITNNPLKVEAMRELGLDVIERIPSLTSPSTHNARYLETKRSRMDHQL